MPDLTFRQSLSSTARAIGMTHSHLNKSTIPQLEAKLHRTQNPCSATDLSENTPVLPRCETGLLLPVKTNIGGSHAQTMDLDTVIAVWEHIATSDSKYRAQAARLLAIGAKVSLEQRYREVFGLKDERPLQDQLLDAWIDLDSLSKRPLLADPMLKKEFLRVTGRAIGDRNPYMGILFSETIWNRLPKDVTDQLESLNPVVRPIGTNSRGKEYGFRKHAYSQLLSDQAFKDAVQPIVATLKGVLTACPDKDQGGYRKCLKIMDQLYPRHTKRGINKNVVQFELKDEHC